MAKQTATTTAAIPKRMRDSMTFSAMQPKSVCRCGHTGDGAQSQHTGFGGHGACIFGDACGCGQFSWKAWTSEYRWFMKHRGHVVR